jgi:hypothetical protein
VRGDGKKEERREQGVKLVRGLSLRNKGGTIAMRWGGAE